MKTKQVTNVLQTTIVTLLTTAATLPLAVHAEKAGIEFSGQISRALSFADNGDDTDVLFVDNNNSGTRLRAKGNTDLGGGVTAGFYWETQYQDNDSSKVDIDSPDTSAAFKSRHRDIWFKGSFGKVSLGQGNGAANGTSEVDYSGTTIAAYSGNNLDDGISFVDGDTTITNGDSFSNYDGLSRNDRIRYDLPAFGPLGIAVSLGDEKTELGLRYSMKMSGGGKFGAALGFVTSDIDTAAVPASFELDTDTGAIAPVAAKAAKDGKFDQLGISASLLLPSGLNISLHYGEKDFNDSAQVDSEGIYLKVGRKSGGHNTSIAFHTVDDLAFEGSEAKRINLAHVYNIPKMGIELFAFVQTSSLDGAGTDYDDVTQVSIGSRIKF